jgi:hypothetical protein
VALPIWKMVLFDRSTGLAIGEFTQYSSGSYTKRLNAAGSAAATLSLDDPVCAFIEPLATVLTFERNGVIVWSGPITSRDDSLPGRSTTIQAVGFFDVLSKRVFRQERTVFTNVDAGQIASAILAQANAQFDTGITLTTVETTVSRTRTYRRFSSMGSAIVELSQVENGFDFEVVGTEMRVYSEQGDDRSASAANGVDQVVLGYQAANQNISTFSRKVDTAGFTNRLSAITTGSVEVVEDSNSVSEYGLYEVTEDLGQVSSDVGRAYAAAEIAVRGLPMETIDVSLITIDEDERCPRFDGNPGDDSHYFGLGDKVRVVIQDPSLPLIDQAFRVFSATVNLDANGAEKVTGLQLAAPLRTTISTIGMVFRDSGGIYSSLNAGNQTSAVTLSGDGYTVTSQPYVNIPAAQTWIVGDATYSVLGVTTILT